jgi:hypothetical protein
MSTRIASRTLPLICALGALLSAHAASSPAAARSPKAAKPALPDVPVRLWMKAPTATGLWTLRIDNEGDSAVRIPADVRLLRFEIDTGDKRRKPVRCSAPPGLRPDGFPEKRALLLPAGQSYIESFDPRLFCFGKDAAALTGAAVVRTRFGWEPPRFSSRPADGPFVAAGTDFPATTQSLLQLIAPTMVLSYNETDPDADELVVAPAPPPPEPEKPDPPPSKRASRTTKLPEPAPPPPPPPEPPAPPAILDENAPRLEVTSEPFSDAPSLDRASIVVTATNVGHRPMTVLLRPHMLSFKVEGVDGVTKCEADPPSHAIPRDNFRTMKPGASFSMTVLLHEVCAQNPFKRQGLYTVTPTLHANEPGTDVGIAAYTGRIHGKSSTLVRVWTAPEPYYPGTPVAIPTPQPPVSEDPPPASDE